jgi:hypothetical protein
MDLSYSFAGLGNPVLGADAIVAWDHLAFYDAGGDLEGYLAQQFIAAAASALIRRDRVRWSSYLLGGAEVQRSELRAYPGTFLFQFAPGVDDPRMTKSLIVAAGVSTMQGAQLALAGADGIDLDWQYRLSFGAGIDEEEIGQTILTGRAAKSLPLPGFARHVVSVRGAYGIMGHRSAGAFGAGGVSGSSLEVVPGYAIGNARHTFGVRGFDPGQQIGVRAAAASFEYRTPLTLLGRGVRLWPLFFQKASVVGFADAGTAWCSFVVIDSFTCENANLKKVWMQSVGAELVIDAAIHYDALYRFRFGIAHPAGGFGNAPRGNLIYIALGAGY